MSNLIIVESPAKAKTIEKFLGKNYKVKASIGHIRDLPKSKLGVDIEDNFNPSYITIRGKASIANELKKEAKKSEKVFLATDPDREGEAISWHLAYILGLDENEKNRIEFNEITKEAVRNAIKNPRKIDKNLVDAQQARRVLDRLVGYKISPILWAKVRKGLSAGRVQSVATKMICDREAEIEKFIPQEYWSISLNTQNSNKENISFELSGNKNKKIEIKNEEQTNKILSEIKGKNLQVKKIEKKNRKKAAYRPFTTSTLQQEAANKLGFTTKKTMQLAQQLYEGISVKGKGTLGLITYMRTDSQRISSEAQALAKEHITSKYGNKYYKSYGYKQTGKNVQDAHECIRPSHIELEPMELENSLNKDQYKLYRLIYSRFIACMMQDALYEQQSINADIDDYNFKANGSKLLFDGFLRVYDYSTSEENILPSVEENEILKVKKILPKQHFTQPPARYNEASLVKTLEELGIGRPSTYSSIISTIQDRGYVEKKQKNLFPTELGKVVTNLLEEYFKQIVDLEFTADIEGKLDTVAEGKDAWKEVVSNFYKPIEHDLEIASKEIERINMDEETDEVCELCGNKMVIKHGRFGKFMACSNYPECKNTKPILQKTGMKCPKCGEGDVIVRKTKRGKIFYGCSSYPKCDFVSWNKPTGELCPQCNSPLAETDKKSKYKTACTNKECKYKK
ncbi:DNA topoisomerase I [Peptoanaerobacter stomatis]|uniref:DNA topoisomerase 1 n=1 Tax=Peptoanaerobacter stomatis TaxID=796937 RepID=V9HV15_9FIRM|nr:type I DNA topoisomerase [Peptoanaerobacter stomatis]EHL18166.1 DNA topoisomerase I [Peptoanaerobacter stomatis]